MKSDTSSRKLPVNPAQWEKVIAKAPGSDRSPTAKERAGRGNAVVATSGGYAAVREALAKKRQGQRGPQQAPTKLPVTVRYNPEVIAYFKATGAGWQTRMNEVLSDWVARRQTA
jgi:uncharacterized protein (DUF4415 family)